MIRNVRADEFDLLLADSQPVVVEFWRDDCNWCKRMAPNFEAVSSSRDDAVFARVNIFATHTNIALAQQCSIGSTPTVKVYFKGREIGELVGFMPRGEFAYRLERILSAAPESVDNSMPIDYSEGKGYSKYL